MEAKRPRNRVAEIPMAVRQQRIDEMVQLFDAGLQPADIAKRHGLTAEYVRRAINSRGRDTSNGWARNIEVHEMWDADEDDRRRMIIERAAKAAAAALRAPA